MMNQSFAKPYWLRMTTLLKIVLNNPDPSIFEIPCSEDRLNQMSIGVFNVSLVVLCWCWSDNYCNYWWWWWWWWWWWCFSRWGDNVRLLQRSGQIVNQVGCLLFVRWEIQDRFDFACRFYLDVRFNNTKFRPISQSGKHHTLVFNQVIPKKHKSQIDLLNAQTQCSMTGPWAKMANNLNTCSLRSCNNPRWIPLVLVPALACRPPLRVWMFLAWASNNSNNPSRRLVRGDRDRWRRGGGGVGGCRRMYKKTQPQSTMLRFGPSTQCTHTSSLFNRLINLKLFRCKKVRLNKKCDHVT